ncbi:MAG: hypothetical protein JWN41_166, partial [Thermoleophilia bacterium]|nr:hypothetical protein [Thermoleophilia bacterium]
TITWTPSPSAAAATRWLVSVKPENAASYVRTVSRSTHQVNLALAKGVVTSIRVDAGFATGHSITGAAIRVVVPIAPRTCTWQPADRTAPTQPTRMRLGRRSASSVKITWRTASDANGVCAYRLSRLVRGRWVTAHVPVGHTAANFGGIKRGARTRIAVQAIDASGNLSPRAELVVRAR